jgi:Leucine-rich repeat (LRR) protein
VYTVSIKDEIELAGKNADAERDALIALYQATDGEHWTNNENWCSDKPVSEWYGITMKDGKVGEVNLFENNLKGELPKEIGNLTELTMLNLAYNELSGSLPDELYNLTKMEYLMLNHNQISGTLSEEIGNMDKFAQESYQTI